MRSLSGSADPNHAKEPLVGRIAVTMRLRNSDSGVFYPVIGCFGWLPHLDSNQKPFD